MSSRWCVFWILKSSILDSVCFRYYLFCYSLDNITSNVCISLNLNWRTVAYNFCYQIFYLKINKHYINRQNNDLSIPNLFNFLLRILKLLWGWNIVPYVLCLYNTVWSIDLNIIKHCVIWEFIKFIIHVLSINHFYMLIFTILKVI